MISRYVATALERARYQLVDDSTFATNVRGLKGVIATGSTLEACRRELTGVIEEWMLVRVARGLVIPPLGKAVFEVPTRRSDRTPG